MAFSAANGIHKEPQIWAIKLKLIDETIEQVLDTDRGISFGKTTEVLIDNLTCLVTFHSINTPGRLIFSPRQTSAIMAPNWSIFV